MTTTTISPLRQRMIEDMNGRKLVSGTQKGHLRSCERFVRFLGRSPDTAVAEDIRRFQVRLADASVDYDAVLMDLQMPEMDGYEAARHIRTEDRWASLPIIALTAHAMSGERAKCLDAGMNDVIPKPIDPGRFHATLSRWINRPSPDLPETSTGQRPDQTQDFDQAITRLGSVPGMDVDRGLGNAQGKPENLLRLIDRLLIIHAAVTEDIEALVAKGDLRSVERLAHSVAGAAGSLGVDGVAEAAIGLEEAIRVSPKWDDEMERLVATLRDELATLADAR